MFTFHSMNKVKREVFAKHKIIQQIDLIEDTGAEPIELGLQMHFHHPYTMSPAAAITRLEALMDAKIPIPLVVGSTPVGRGFLTLFVVEEISSKMSKFISSSLIVGDIDVKIIEYAGALNLAGPLSALGGALPGLSNAVASITGAISGVTGTLNTVVTASNMLGFGSRIGAGSGVLSSLSGVTNANNLSAMLSSLNPGAITQVRAASSSVMQKALANLRAAGH